MSIRLMNEVWSLDLSATSKIVLLSLADQANEEGVCWPSIAHIAKRSSVSTRTVHRCISQMAATGLLEVISGGNGVSNNYRLTPDRVSPLTECHPCHSVSKPLTECHPKHKEPPSVYKRGVRPSQQEVDTYAAEIGMKGEQATEFFDYYTSKGWLVGKSPMKDWRAALRNWHRRSKQYSSSKAPESREASETINVRRFA